MSNDLKLILTRLQQHFRPRRNTRYWVQIVLDPYDHAFNFFFNQQKRHQRLKSIPLHTITESDLATLEKIVTALQARFQFTIDYVGFTGLRWPQAQTLIQRKKFWEE